MRVLIARYRVHPGRGDEVEALLKDVAVAVRDDEPGCVTYRAVRSVDDSDLFILYEEYVDQAALLAHRETEHFRRFIEGGAVPLLESREREVGELVASDTDGGVGAGP